MEMTKIGAIAITVFIALVLGMSILGNTLGNVQDSSEKFSDEYLCEHQGGTSACIYNVTKSATLSCRKFPNQTLVCPAGQERSIPLLPDVSELIPMIVLAGAIIGLGAVAWHLSKK